LKSQVFGNELARVPLSRTSNGLYACWKTQGKLHETGLTIKGKAGLWLVPECRGKYEVKSKGPAYKNVCQIGTLVPFTAFPGHGL